MKIAYILKKGYFLETVNCAICDAQNWQKIEKSYGDFSEKANGFGPKIRFWSVT